MLIQDWMTSEVVSVTPDTSVLKIGKLMRDNHLRRIAVVDAQNRVVGIISDRDVRDASPSKATTLDMYEMHYLLAELKGKDIMTAKPITVKPTDSVERAAMLMLDNKIGGLPVVDDAGCLVGILSDQDVFKTLVNITGVREGGIQVGFEIVNEPGAMKPVFDMLREHGARVLSILSANNQSGTRQMFLRLRDMESAPEAALKTAMSAYVNLLYWTVSGPEQG
ncbi:MAG: CBS and ACT domain-containing protein [Desulfovibrionaceae bacterium]|nr:CBS and ACT domain-containing protein [Desulfovibrionaceae bacterium]